MPDCATLEQAEPATTDFDGSPFTPDTGRKAIAQRYAIPKDAREAREWGRFDRRMLSRTRTQITRIFTLLGREDDPGKIVRLAAALAKLEEIERRLSDRRLPPKDKGKLDE